MGKADYKKTNKGKTDAIVGRAQSKRYICVSRKWLKWAKRYVNRAYRRNNNGRESI